MIVMEAIASTHVTILILKVCVFMMPKFTTYKLWIAYLFN